MKKHPKSCLILASFLAVLVEGCGIYKSNFDCPPGKGVGCASTSEVLDMIVEKQSDSEDPFDSGKNLFVPDTRRKK